MIRLRHFLLLILSIKCIKCQITCGVSKASAKGLIVGGEYANREAWPWLTALIHKETNKYFCAGSIITKKHVLTGKIT